MTMLTGTILSIDWFEITTKASTRCFAWAFIPNHFHLLLETGQVPISVVMQKLLTGYATTFNLRHHRHGHFFQNRYKSILCQEDTYLLELVRYINLNPLRAGIVTSYEELRRYPYCGQSCVVGLNCKLESWMPTKQILERFGRERKESLKAYEAFVVDGITQGQRPDLTGGGLVRSAGSWHAVIAAREYGVFLKSDERILGNSDFVDEVLSEVEAEEIEKKSLYHRDHIDVEHVIAVVAKVLGIKEDEVRKADKQPRHVQARALLCFWAIRELGLTATFLAKELGNSQPAVSQAVIRGELLVREHAWNLRDLLKASPEQATE
ncbi:transposase [Geomonas sp. Red276]